MLAQVLEYEQQKNKAEETESGLRAQIAVFEVRMGSILSDKLAAEAELRSCRDDLLNSESRALLAEEGTEAYKQLQFLEKVNVELQNK
jgi:hypothetical protein